MSKRKNLLFVLILFGLLFLCINFKVYASEEAFSYRLISEKDGYELIAYNGDASEVVIPYSYNGKRITRIGNYCFQNNQYVKKITIQDDGVKQIGIGAFNGCSNLEVVILPIDLEVISEYMFENCNNLKKVYNQRYSGTDGNANESVYIGPYIKQINSSAFKGCINISSFYVYPQNQNYKTYKGVLYTKDGLELVNYPAGNTSDNYIFLSTVTKISDYAFYNNQTITNLIIPEKVTNIGKSAFEKMAALTSIKINGKIEKITERMLSDCPNLKYIYIPSTVKKIEVYGLSSLPNIQSINLPEGIEIIDNYAFRNNKSLMYVILPKSIKSIGDFVFLGCTDLFSICFLGTEIVQLNSLTFYSSPITNIYCKEDLIDDYQDILEEFNIYPYDENISSFEADIDSIKLSYELNEQLYLGDSKLKVIYNDNTIKTIEITQQMIFNFNTASVGSKEMILIYNGITYKIPYTVLTPRVIDVNVEENSFNKDIIQGEAVVINDGKFILSMSDGTTRKVSIKKENIIDYDTNSLDGYIRFNYDGFIVEYPLNIIPFVPVSEIEINNLYDSYFVYDIAYPVGGVYPAEASFQNVIWSTSNDNAIVDELGKISFLKPGKVKIIASTYRGEVIASKEIIIRNAYIEFLFDYSKEISYVGDVFEFDVKLSGRNYSNLYYEVIDYQGNRVRLLNPKLPNPKILFDSSGLESGRYTINAVLQMSNGDEEIISSTIYFEIRLENIEFYDENKIMYIGEEWELELRFTPLNASNKKYKIEVSNPSIVAYSNGKITALKSGTTKVKVISEDGNFEDVLDIEVKTSDIITASSNQEVYGAGQEIIINYEIRGNDFNLVLLKIEGNSYSFEEELDVNEEYIFSKYLQPGTYNLSIVLMKENESIVKTQEVTINQMVYGVELSDKELSIYVNDEVRIGYEVLPYDAINKKVTFASSDSSIVSVDEEGNIKALKPGVVIISVTTDEGGIVNSCKVNVSNATITLPYLSDGTNLVIREAKEVIAEIKGTNYDSIRLLYKHEDNTSYVIEDLKLDNNSFTFTPEGNSNGKATLRLELVENGELVNYIEYSLIIGGLLEDIEVLNFGVNGEVRYSWFSVVEKADIVEKIEVKLYPSNAINSQLFWSSSDPLIADVDNDGNITYSKTPGYTKITIQNIDKTVIREIDLIIEIESGFTISKLGLNEYTIDTIIDLIPNIEIDDLFKIPLGLNFIFDVNRVSGAVTIKIEIGFDKIFDNKPDLEQMKFKDELIKEILTLKGNYTVSSKGKMYNLRSSIRMLDKAPLVGKDDSSFRFEYNVAILGYLEATFIPSQIDSLSDISFLGGVIFCVDAGATFVQPIPIFNIPFVLTIGFGGELEIVFKMFDQTESIEEVAFDLDVYISAYLEVLFGLGIKLVNAGFGGRINFQLDIVNIFQSPELYFYIYGDIFAYLKVWRFRYELKIFSYNMGWDLTKNSEQEKQLLLEELEAYYDQTVAKVSRDYIKLRAISHNFSIDTDFENVLNNTYSETYTKFVKFDDKYMLLWLDDNEDLDYHNSINLYYSIFENGDWSSPKVVNLDGTSDWVFDAEVIDGEVYIIYQNLKDKIDEYYLTENNLSTLENIRSAIGLDIIKYDKSSDNFINNYNLFSYLNNGETIIDSKLIRDDMGLIATWTTIDNIDIIGSISTDKYKIYESRLINDSWTVPEIIFEKASHEIIDYDYQVHNGQKLVVVITRSLAEDKSKYHLYSSYKGVEKELTNSYDYLADVILIDSNLFFVNDSKLNVIEDIYSYINNIGDIKNLDILVNNANSYDIIQDSNGNRILYYVTERSGLSEVYVHYYDELTKEWTKAVKVLSSSKKITYFSMIFGFDDELIYFYNENYEAEYHGEVIETSNLIVDKFKGLIDISIKDYLVNYLDIIENNELGLDIYVANNGLLDINDFDLNIYNQDYDLIFSKKITELLKVGNLKLISIKIPLVEDIENIIIELSTPNENNENKKDNISSAIECVLPNLAVEIDEMTESNGIITVKVNVINNGYIKSLPSSMNIRFGEETTITREIPALEPNEQYQIISNFVVSKFDSSGGYVRLEYLLDDNQSEYQYADNSIHYNIHFEKLENQFNLNNLIITSSNSISLNIEEVFFKNLINPSLLIKVINTGKLEEFNYPLSICSGVLNIDLPIEIKSKDTIEVKVISGDIRRSNVISTVSNGQYFVGIEEIIAEDITIDGNLPKKLNITISPINATMTKLTYTSLNEDIVKVREDGLLIPVKNGRAKVIATAYDGKQVEIEVLVVDIEEPKELVSISLDTSNIKVKYFVGESLNLEGLIVKAKYSNNEEIRLQASEYQINTSDFGSNIGTYTIFVVYGGKEASFEVEVIETVKKVVKIEIEGLKTQYKIGEKLNSDQWVVKVEYEDGSIEVIDSTKYSYTTDFDSDISDKYELIIKLKDSDIQKVYEIEVLSKSNIVIYLLSSIGVVIIFVVFLIYKKRR